MTYMDGIGSVAISHKLYYLYSVIATTLSTRFTSGSVWYH